ncbi:MAG: hypothetical protein GX085_04030 [Firmicutes bacterium]|nr:hypothetical protein [Bacillota bacterium]
MNKFRAYLAIFIFLFSPLTMAVEGLFLPCNHPAYEDLAELARGGLLPGYPWQYISEQQKTLTRYEMAYYLKGLIIRLDDDLSPPALTAREKYILKRLVQEFGRELTALGLSMEEFERLAPVKLASVSGFRDGYLELDLILQANRARARDTVRQQAETLAFYRDLERRPPGGLADGEIVQTMAGIQIGNLSLATGYIYKNPYPGFGSGLSGRNRQGDGLFNWPGLLRREKEEDGTEDYWHLDFQGRVSLFRKTSVHAGLQWNFQPGRDRQYHFPLLNPRVNAGVSFQLSDYLRMIVDYQWYNESAGGERILQTSFGLEWGSHALLTLKYQALLLEPALIKGELTFRF